MPTHDSGARRGALIILFAIAIMSFVRPPAAGSNEKVSPVLLSEIVGQQTNHLAKIDSNAGAMALFTTTIGASLGLKDAAGILGANGLPTKLARELGVAELSHSAHELMAALAAWQFADRLLQTSDRDHSPKSSSVGLPSTTRQDWLKANSRVSSLITLFGLLTTPAVSDTPHAELLLAAHQVTFEASQRATMAWWKLYRWKERIRQARGRARLCGTWQWVVHNHRDHREQKMVMSFPPDGPLPNASPLPAETVILGDTIYLRWEQAGRIQEDSLLFIKDGTRIEGSFVNNSGGWGSITGKRTADCRS